MSRPIRAIGIRLSAVYCIGILDFVFDETRNELDKYVHRVQLTDQDCRVFYDKLTLLYIEMPKFSKTEAQLENHFDKWLYFIKNLENLDTIPDPLHDRIYTKAFATAEIAQFNQHQLDAYEDSLKVFRDMNNVPNTAIEEATIEVTKVVTEKVTKEVTQAVTRDLTRQLIQNSSSAGLTDQIIAQPTGLSLDEIEQWRTGTGTGD